MYECIGPLVAQSCVPRVENLINGLLSRRIQIILQENFIVCIYQLCINILFSYEI